MSLSALLELVKIKSFDDAIKNTAKNIDNHHGNLPKPISNKKSPKGFFQFSMVWWGYINQVLTECKED